ncbi:MAG: cystathionine beta-lyase, partial [Bacteroidetes bacterium SW_11_45_7]
PLTLEDGRYVMDFDDLTAKISRNTKMLLLCNPHNPVGRVWKRHELEQLGRICVANDILLIADEIHDDIIYSGHHHYPIANLGEELANNTITLSSPGKTFNLQGMQMGYAIIPEPSIKKVFSDQLARNWVHLYNPLTIEATRAAYQEGEEWLNDLLAYLEQNRDHLVDYIHKNIPGIDVIVPDGTYICWLDCRALSLSQVELRDLMTNKAKVGLNDGMSFGTGGEGFQRLNFACPGSTLEEGLQRISDAVKGLSQQK